MEATIQIQSLETRTLAAVFPGDRLSATLVPRTVTEVLLVFNRMSIAGADPCAQLRVSIDPALVVTGKSVTVSNSMFDHRSFSGLNWHQDALTDSIKTAAIDIIKRHFLKPDVVLAESKLQLKASAAQHLAAIRAAVTPEDLKVQRDFAAALEAAVKAVPEGTTLCAPSLPKHLLKEIVELFHNGGFRIDREGNQWTVSNPLI